jgi:glycosyltransferase involved in cell wall biosynthesis
VRLTLLARADRTGLGYQTKAYHKWLKPNRTIVIDMSIINGNQTEDWYPQAEKILGLPTNEQLDFILQDTDVLLTAETSYNLNLYRRAKELGVKTVCVENPEFYDHIQYPQYEMPDLIILPSVWQYQYIKDHAESRGTKVLQIHHPVDREEYPFRLREDNFVMHIAGKPASHDRNGTYDFLDVCADGIVTTQSDDLAYQLRHLYRHSNIYTNITDNLQLYNMADILVLPRKYGGNCLPLNEALSTGMPVIMTDIEPNNHLLPKEWLVPAYKVDYFEPRGVVDIYQVDKQLLHEKINWFRSQDIKELSQQANKIANTISWETLLPKYKEALEML